MCQTPVYVPTLESCERKLHSWESGLIVFSRGPLPCLAFARRRRTGLGWAACACACACWREALVV